MVSVKPAGSSLSSQTANQVCLTVSYLEQYKKPRKCKSSTPIQVTVAYSTGELEYSATSLFVPVVATITAVYVKCDGSTTMRTFAETFDIAFQGQDSLTDGASIYSLGKISNASTSCCGVTNLTVDDSLLITVS